MIDAQAQLLPIAIFLAMAAIGIELQWYQFRDMAKVPIGATLLQLFLLVVLPVVAGMLWRQKFPGFVLPRVGTLQKWTQLFLYAVIVLMLFQQADLIGPAISEALPWAVGLCFAVLPTVYFGAVLIVGFGFARFWRVRQVRQLNPA